MTFVCTSSDLDSFITDFVVDWEASVVAGVTGQTGGDQILEPPAVTNYLLIKNYVKSLLLGKTS